MTARARRLPFLFSEAVHCQMVIYPEQDSGRGAGYEGIQREAWMVMDAISFHYFSCFENSNFTPETMNVIGFWVFTAKGLISVCSTRMKLTKVLLPDEGAETEETLQK